MLVKNRMTPRPITIGPDASVDKALQTMRAENVRRLPVVEKGGKLVGIVSELDLLKVSPSPATSLSIYEIPYLLSKIKMQDIMTKDVIAVREETTLEEAARIMADNKIGGLPVVEDGKLVGIITETDLFKVFLEMLGAREEAVRISVVIPEQKGILAKVTSSIAEKGGDIRALTTFKGDDPSTAKLLVRVIDVSEDDMAGVMKDLGLDVEDRRYCALPACD